VTIKSLFYVFIAWLLLNAIFPMFLNSIERLYQVKIDFIARGITSLLKWIMLGVLQIILLIWCLPTILLIVLLERTFPKIFTYKSWASVQHSMNLLVTRDFWATMAKEYADYKNGKNK